MSQPQLPGDGSSTPTLPGGRRRQYALQAVTNQEPRWNPEFERMYRVLLHLKSCEPAIAEGLMRLTIGSIYNFVEGEVLLGMREDRGEQRKAG